MATRSNIRPRPVDINKQLLTVKDVAELDAIDLQAAELGGQVCSPWQLRGPITEQLRGHVTEFNQAHA